MSWILLPWPSCPQPEGKDPRVVLVDLRESPKPRRPFREEKPERVQEEKAEDPPGLTTSTRTGIEAKGPTIVRQTPQRASKEEREEVRVGGLRKEEIGGLTTRAMGVFASRQLSGCPSSTPPEETAYAIEPESVKETAADLRTEPSVADVQDVQVEEPPPPDVEEDQEVTSQTLEESEDTTSHEDSESSEEDASEKEEEASPSSRSSADWEAPPFFPRPWMRFATVLSEVEPWNTRAWHGFEPSLHSWGGFPAVSWGSVLPMSERLRCSIVYASVILRSYRRKMFRRMKASVADWKFMPTCPKRSPHPTAKAELQDL
jgi:hypothetical protein